MTPLANSAPGADAPAAPLHFRRRHRLSGARAYQAVYQARLRKHRGPLTVYARPNDLDHPRLGLSVAARVGGAVTRHTIKRRLREAFRLLQHEIRRPLDLVINVQPHEPLPMDEYSRLLSSAWQALDEECRRRETRGSGA